MSWLTRFTPISLLFMHICLTFSNYHSCIISPCGCDYYRDVYVHGHTICTTNKSTLSLKILSKNTRRNVYVHGHNIWTTNKSILSLKNLSKNTRRNVYAHGHTIWTTNKSTASLKNLSKNSRRNMRVNANFHRWQSITWNGCPKTCCLFKIVFWIVLRGSNYIIHESLSVVN